MTFIVLIIITFISKDGLIGQSSSFDSPSDLGDALGLIAFIILPFMLLIGVYLE